MMCVLTPKRVKESILSIIEIGEFPISNGELFHEPKKFRLDRMNQLLSIIGFVDVERSRERYLTDDKQESNLPDD
jgi:hypothetical protein